MKASSLFCSSLILALLALGIAGCVSKKPEGMLAKAKDDLSEYREATAAALRVVKTTMQSYDKTCAEQPCPPKTLETFTKDVEQLEIDSFSMRERAMAMKAMGEAYFLAGEFSQDPSTLAANPRGFRTLHRRASSHAQRAGKRSQRRRH